MKALCDKDRFNAVTSDANSTTNVIDSLEEYSYKLAKIKAWLTMSGPPDDGTFPFYLGLKNARQIKSLQVET